MNKNVMKLYSPDEKPPKPDVVSVCKRFRFPHCPIKNEWVFPGGVSFRDRNAAERHSKKVIEQYKAVRVGVSGQSCRYSDKWGKKRRGIVLGVNPVGVYRIRSRSGRTIEAPNNSVTLLRDYA